MGIEVILRSESLEDLASVSDSRMILARAATSTQFSELRLLKYLDPCGDVVFNRAQAGDLLDDIRLFAKAQPTSPVSRHLLEIQPLVEQLAAGTHLYLWFLGD